MRQLRTTPEALPTISPMPDIKNNRDTSHKAIGMIRNLLIDLRASDDMKVARLHLDEIITCYPHLHYLNIIFHDRSRTYCSFTATSTTVADNTSAICLTTNISVQLLTNDYSEITKILEIVTTCYPHIQHLRNYFA